MTTQLNNNKISDEPLARERGFWDKSGNPDNQLADEGLDFVMDCYPDIAGSETCEIPLLVNRTELKSLCGGMMGISEEEFTNHLFKMINHGVAILLNDAQVKDVSNDLRVLKYAIEKYGKKAGGSDPNKMNDGIHLDWPSGLLLGCTVEVSPEAERHLEELSRLLGICPAELVIIAIWESLMTQLRPGTASTAMADNLTAFWGRVRQRQMMIRHDLRSYSDIRTEYWQEELGHMVEKFNKDLTKRSKEKKAS